MKRVIISAALAMFLAPAVHAKNTAMLEMRINGTCNTMASGSGPASPDVLFDMCWRGARDAYKGKPATCRNKIKQFDLQAQKLSGIERAEYVQIGSAYRIGCNAGESAKNAGL
ncbi:hypothetical protein [Serratia liquefaciens]|uniref:hypothetical protein n=1 Tax=Serratia liquefaciens TaxID=614 RepID=UPI0021584B8C|nr:hypothetical protein [Serratia liquefaciens]